MRRRLIAGLVGAALVAGLAGCAPTATPEPAESSRPVTTEEAELLAIVRFGNFDAGARSVAAAFVDQGHEIGLVGWVDYTTHTGFGLLTVDGTPDRRLIWDGAVVATDPATGDAPLTVPTSVEGWSGRVIDASGTPLEALLLVLAKLGSDRPENPLLLQQGGALWLASQNIGDTPVTVFAGPAEGAVDGEIVDDTASAVRYWVDADGLLRRLEVRLGATWATVDFDDAEGVTVPALLEGLGGS